MGFPFPFHGSANSWSIYAYSLSRLQLATLAAALVREIAVWRCVAVAVQAAPVLRMRHKRHLLWTYFSAASHALGWLAFIPQVRRMVVCSTCRDKSGRDENILRFFSFPRAMQLPSACAWSSCEPREGFLPDRGWWAFVVTERTLNIVINRDRQHPEPDATFFDEHRNARGTVFAADAFQQLAADLSAFLHERFAVEIAARDFDRTVSWVIVSSAAFERPKFFRLRYSSATNAGYPFLEEKHDPADPTALPNVLVAVFRDNVLRAGFARVVSDPFTVPLAEFISVSELPRITSSLPPTLNPRKFDAGKLGALYDVDFANVRAREYSPRTREFPSPPRHSIVTTARCLRELANLRACNFSFQTRCLHFRLSRNSDGILHMTPVEPSVAPVKDRHQDYNSLGERFEAAVTDDGDAIYSFNTLDLGDGVTVHYTAQQDAVDASDNSIVEVKTLQRPRNEPLQWLPLPMNVACFLRNVDKLCLGIFKGDTLLRTEVLSRQEFRRLDERKQLPAAIGFLCKTLKRLHDESGNWAPGDAYALLYTYPDHGFVLRKSQGGEGQPQQ